MADSANDVARRLEAALDMFEDGVELTRSRFARENPAATPEEIDAMVERWLSTHPGAEYGDAPGRPRATNGA